MNIYFITGTDTDCGKTYVSCQLLDYFHSQNKKALAIKPVASGCFEYEGELQNEDVLNLQKHNQTTQRISNWQFLPPISPHLAAEREGLRLSASDIAAFCQREKFKDFDYLLIEGAGGLLVPLNEQETWLDFIKLMQIPVILVVGMRLGCLNHALLTEEVLKTKQIECLGWIANCLDPKMLALSENLASLTKKMQIPLIATVAYREGIDWRDVATAKG